MGNKKILVIRRDNIGDLVCTTPLLSFLRERFPNAEIHALVNSYNAPVLKGNSLIDRVYIYTKNKHRGKGSLIFSWLLARFSLLWRLRAAHFDDVILAAPEIQRSAVRFSRFIAPKRVFAPDLVGGHEVERIASLTKKYGSLPALAMGPCKVVPDPGALDLFRTNYPSLAGKIVIGVHISARKPSQRWPTDKFVVVLKKLHRLSPESRIALFWAPGTSTNLKHPGDDEKAQEIVDAVGEKWLVPCPTGTLEELIAGLSNCRLLICADGGAMHLAAGVGVPIVCMFGDSSAERWHPWGVPYVLLQKQTKEVSSISPDEVFHAAESLLKRLPEHG